MMTTGPFHLLRLILMSLKNAASLRTTSRLWTNAHAAGKKTVFSNSVPSEGRLWDFLMEFLLRKD